MDIKRKLYIAREIALNWDFVTEDASLEEIVDECGIECTTEELEEILEDYSGWSLTYVEDEIISEYFRS